MRSSMPWGKRFLVLLVLGGLLTSSSGCGLCAKRCLVQAIEMRDKKPVWVKERCEKCSACINCCPKEAIEFGEWSKGVYRYTFGKYYKSAH